jgi:dienelactone hydrolase
MSAFVPLVLAGLAFGAAPPDPWSQLAFRTPAGKHDARSAREDVLARLRLAGRAETAAWEKLKGRHTWERYRAGRLEALRRSLGRYPGPPDDLRVRIRGTIKDSDYRIDNLTFESRPGLVVTANLYRPAKPGKAMPGILIVHSHHAPKTQVELQDMGVMWARAGCLVLVMDQLGHGERRQHPFRTRADYPKPFQPSRQDYYFRHNLAIQLQTIGDGLMGWMVWDIQRGVDLLLSRSGVDPKKIILLGAVAGGGDPAAVAGALDRRIAAVVPFNFGGPQPESRYPLPEKAEDRFLYTGTGSWESTRNLYRSAKGGFLPWLIVGSIAPRRLIYAHEFAWDRDHDPVWKRLQQIHSWYDGAGNLASTHGSGSVRGRSPKDTHCTNIGRVHRKEIHAAFKRWFGIDAREPVKPMRQPGERLLCLPDDEHPLKVHVLAGRIARERLREARKRWAALPADRRRTRLREEWARLVGKEPADARALAGDSEVDLGRVPGGRASHLPLAGVVLIRPVRPAGKRMPVVVAVGQGGPRAFLKHRSRELGHLLAKGTAVALVDLGGMSNQMPGTERGRRSTATALGSSEQMLGGTMLGRYLTRVEGALLALRWTDDLDPDGISIWGESFAAVNPPGARLEVPLELPQPPQAEPLGPIVALLAALFDEKIQSVHVRGGLVGYESLLNSPFCHVPYDSVVPGVLMTGDLADVVAALAPRRVLLEGLVDGLNRKVPAKEVDRVCRVARDAYRTAKAAEKLRIVQ